MTEEKWMARMLAPINALLEARLDDALTIEHLTTRPDRLKLPGRRADLHAGHIA
jgi:hypothetical protein